MTPFGAFWLTLGAILSLGVIFRALLFWLEWRYVESLSPRGAWFKEGKQYETWKHPPDCKGGDYHPCGCHPPQPLPRAKVYRR